MSVLYIRDGSGNFIPIPSIDGKSAYEYAKDGGYTGTEAEFAEKLAKEIPEPYTLPTASTDVKGGVKVGTGLQMHDETLDADVTQDDIDKLAEEIADIYGTTSIRRAIELTQGAIYGGADSTEIVPENTHVRTKGYTPFVKGDTVKFINRTGGAVNFAVYDYDENYVYISGADNFEINIKADETFGYTFKGRGSYYRCRFYRSEGLTPNELDGVVWHESNIFDIVENMKIVAKNEKFIGLGKPIPYREVEYLGLNTASLERNKPIVYSVEATSTKGRIYYRIECKKGDKISLRATEKWVHSSFQYEPLEYDENGVMTKTTGFRTADGKTEYVVSGENTTGTYIGIRFEYGMSPESWNVTDNDYKGAFQVTMTPNESYAGNPVIVGADGRLIVDDALQRMSVMVGLNKGIVITGKGGDILPPWHGLLEIHRGWGTAPNNTLQAIWLAKKNGFGCCEIDLRETADGVIVLAHDATVTGVVNGNSMTYTIAEVTFDTLSVLRYSNATYPNCGVASFEDVLKLCSRVGIALILDLKISTTSFALKVLELVQRYGMIEQVFFFCWQNEELMTAIHEKNSKANLLINAIPNDDAMYDEYLSDTNKFIIAVPASGISSVTPELRNTLADKGYLIGVWGVTPETLSAALEFEPYFIEPTDETKSTVDWVKLINQNTMNTFDVQW